jgi:formylglycine-generating enzyme required for sulfatase activity
MISSLFLLVWAQAVPETVELPGTKIKFQVVSIPGGKAKIGSPQADPDRKPDEPLRELEVQPFQMGVHEVTWAEFNAFHTNPKDLDAVTRPSHADTYFGDAGIPADFLEPRRPLTNVRWHSAVMYCEWLSRKTGRYFRLPTEVEWEYAARAGSDAPAPAKPGEVAWFKGNSQEKTHVGGGKAPNAFGVYDLLGNVWEYALEPYAFPDYSPVIRGGCWSSPARELRYANRQTIPYRWFSEDSNLPRSVWWLTASEVSIGFRVVCVADAADQKERDAYALKIETKILGHKEKTLTIGPSNAPYRAVTGEVKNTGDRTLDELELEIFYVGADGKPHLTDQSGSKPGRGCFSKCWPVLRNSALEGDVRKSLAPGETRSFQVDLPQSYDIETQKTPKVTLSGKVTALKFSK